MTWAPPPRLEWVSAVNAGRILPIADEAAQPLDRDALLAEARARLGMGDDGSFGDDGFLEPLDVLLPALRDEARLTVLGRWMTRRFLLRLLEVRLQLVEYLRRDPGVRDEVIDQPLFVTGAPRTGTTILHGALARDPRHRAPEGWELLRPVPPPSPDPQVFATDARIPLADRELRMMAEVTGTLDGIHEYGARMPKECLSSMSFEFRSEEFTARYDIPSYVEWLQRCNMRPAYEAHKLVLQVLQRRFGDGARWVLKSPVHLHSLPTLLAVYPDARLAVTHRDPLVVLGSATSLVATLRWAHSDDVDFAGIGRYHSALYGGALDGLVTLTEGGALDLTRVHHLQYADFAADPLGAVRGLYAQLDRPLGTEVEQNVNGYLATQPKGRHGGHAYDFDDLGLDRDAERARFARYQSFFRVPTET